MNKTDSTSTTTDCFYEKIGSITYVIRMKTSEEAKQPADDYFRKVIGKRAKQKNVETAVLFGVQ